MGEAVFVGVDGGGSHTRAVVGRVDGVVLGRGEAGASNPSALGFEAAVAAIEAAVGAALERSAAAREVAGSWAVEAIALGVAGAGRPADRARLEALLRARPGFP